MISSFSDCDSRFVFSSIAAELCYNLIEKINTLDHLYFNLSWKALKRWKEVFQRLECIDVAVWELHQQCNATRASVTSFRMHIWVENGSCANGLNRQPTRKEMVYMYGVCAFGLHSITTWVYFYTHIDLMNGRRVALATNGFLWWKTLHGSDVKLPLSRMVGTWGQGCQVFFFLMSSNTTEKSLPLENFQLQSTLHNSILKGSTSYRPQNLV